VRFRQGHSIGGRRVKDDVIRFVFDREDAHVRFPFADASALMTWITPVANTSKWIAERIYKVPQTTWIFGQIITEVNR
jgi:hypothetical protein